MELASNMDLASQVMAIRRRLQRPARVGKHKKAGTAPVLVRMLNASDIRQTYVAPAPQKPQHQRKAPAPVSDMAHCSSLRGLSFADLRSM